MTNRTGPDRARKRQHVVVDAWGSVNISLLCSNETIQGGWVGAQFSLKSCAPLVVYDRPVHLHSFGEIWSNSALLLSGFALCLVYGGERTDRIHE